MQLLRGVSTRSFEAIRWGSRRRWRSSTHGNSVVPRSFWGEHGDAVLQKLARELELPKLTFQVIRRTIATLGKTKGHPKDIQGLGLMRHSRQATTMEVYMQSLQKEVRTAINLIHDELMANRTNGSGPQPSTAPETRADHGVKSSGGGLLMERKRKQKRDDGEKKTPSRCKILPFAGKMRANGLAGVPLSS
jgi:hypothetical protein